MEQQPTTGRTQWDLIAEHVIHPLRRIRLAPFFMAATILLVIVAALYYTNIVSFKRIGSSIQITITKPTVPSSYLAFKYKKSLRLHENYRYNLPEIELSLMITQIEEKSSWTGSSRIEWEEAIIEVQRLNSEKPKESTKQYAIKKDTIIPIIIEDINFYIKVESVTMNPKEAVLLVYNLKPEEE